MNMQELLKVIASGLVEKPEQVSVTVEEAESGATVYHLHVAIRVVMRAAAIREDKKIMVEID